MIEKHCGCVISEPTEHGEHEADLRRPADARPGSIDTTLADAARRGRPKAGGRVDKGEPLFPRIECSDGS